MNYLIKILIQKKLFINAESYLMYGKAQCK